MTPSPTHLVIIPSYNAGKKLAETVRQALLAGSRYGWCWTAAPTAARRLWRKWRAGNGLRVLTLERNSGKGAAVLHAMLAASREGFTHALVLDADGQHSVADIPGSCQPRRLSPAMILGVPQFAADAPASRRHGRRVGNWWANLETFWGGIEDSLFGFRVYPFRNRCASCKASAARGVLISTPNLPCGFFGPASRRSTYPRRSTISNRPRAEPPTSIICGTIAAIRRHTLLVLEMLPQMKRIWKLRQRAKHGRKIL